MLDDLALTCQWWLLIENAIRTLETSTISQGLLSVKQNDSVAFNPSAGHVLLDHFWISCVRGNIVGPLHPIWRQRRCSFVVHTQRSPLEGLFPRQRLGVDGQPAISLGQDCYVFLGIEVISCIDSKELWHIVVHSLIYVHILEIGRRGKFFIFLKYNMIATARHI